MSNKKVRIAIVISHPIQHFCPQYVSFAENDEIELKVFFGSALGHKKYVDENFKTEVNWNNLQLERFPHRFLNGEQVIQPDKNLDAPSLEKELEHFHPDLLFTYGYFQKLQRRSHGWAIKNKVPIAYISDSELRHPENTAKRWLKSFFLRRYFSKVSYFLTMGDANEAYYRKYQVPSEKLLRMHYPIDYRAYQESFLQKDRLRAGMRNQYSIHENEMVFSVVGKLVAWKNLDHIIEAIKLLEDEGIFVHLFIIGSGNMRSEWEEKAGGLKKNKVHFTGFVKAEDLPSYYANTDIYVHPASLEPHSVAISEAIIMGCPVILSDRCGSYGATDDVQEGKNGFVYPFGDIKLLAEKIKLLVKDNRLRKDFSGYSHQLGMQFQQNSHHNMLEQLLKRFRESNTDK
jgi:glycosyltransferase involved in cell wall biosynthesis